MGLYGSSRTVAHADAQAAGADGVAVYWRPGCTFCLALRTTLLGVSDRAAWVDIHRDDEARAWVRSVNDGNETVPTVLIDGVAHTNPAPGAVRRRLTGPGGPAAG